MTMKTVIENDQQVEMIDLIKAEFPVQSIRIFGSYAKGNATDDSDLDVLVVLQGENSLTFEQRLAYKVQLSRTLEEIRSLRELDIKIYTDAEWQYLNHSQNWFALEINKTGITIYEQ